VQPSSVMITYDALPSRHLLVRADPADIAVNECFWPFVIWWSVVWGIVKASKLSDIK
jgi:hypothetical protein